MYENIYWKLYMECKCLVNIPFYHAAVDNETNTKSCNHPIQNEQGFQIRFLQFLICKDRTKYMKYFYMFQV